MARNYKNMEIFHLGYDFCFNTFKLLNKKFPKTELELISQIKRCALSLPSNIAEGSAKRSNGEFLYYLNVSYASAKELEVYLDLSKDLRYISSKEFSALKENLDKFVGKLFLFLNTLEQRTNKSYKSLFFKKVLGNEKK